MVHLTLRRVLQAVSCFLFLSSSPSRGIELTDMDYGAVFRSRSLALLASGHIGTTHQFWGENQGNRGRIAYGYWAADLTYETALLANILTPEISLYPLPIVGLHAGYELYHGLTDSFDLKDACQDRLSCRGLVRKPYLRGVVKLGAASFFLGLVTQYSRPSKAVDQDFFYPRSDLIIPRRGAGTIMHLVILGYEFSQRFWLAALAYEEMVQGSGERSGQVSLGAQWSWRSSSLFVGLGDYWSSSFRQGSSPEHGPSLVVRYGVRLRKSGLRL